MADRGAGTGIMEGVGNILGMLGDRFDTQHQDQLKQRELIADHLESQAKEIGDNIMRVGGFDAPEAAPLVESLGKVTERYRNLFPPHETPKLIQRLRKFVGLKETQPQEDPRAQLDVGQVMARARRPEYEKTRKGQLEQAATTREIAGENAIEAQGLQRRINDADIQHAIQAGLPQEQIDQLKAIKEGLPPSLMRPPAEKSGQWKIVTGKMNGEPYSYWHSESTNENTDLHGRPLPGEGLAGFVPDPKSASTFKPKTAWSKDDKGQFFSVMLDANNQEMPGTRNYNVVPPASIVGRITSGVYHWTDEDYNLHETPYTTSSRPAYSGGGGAPPTAPQNPAGGPPSSPAGNPSQTAPTAAPGAAAAAGGAAAAKPPTTAAKPPQGAPKPPTATAGARGGGNIPATPAQAQERILGRKESPSEKEARTTLNTAHGLVAKADDAWNHPSASNDKMLVISLVRDAAGRFNIAEYETLIRGAGLGNTIQQWVENVKGGELPKPLRKQIVDATKNNLKGAQAAFDASRRSASDVSGAPGDVDAKILELLNKH